MSIDPKAPPPVAYHAYLSDASGHLIGFKRVTTDRCPACGRVHPEARLGVTAETDRTETVLCLLCDHGTTRPKQDNRGMRVTPPDQQK